jgi:hypothetical protein
MNADKEVLLSEHANTVPDKEVLLSEHANTVPATAAGRHRESTQAPRRNAVSRGLPQRRRGGVDWSTRYGSPVQFRIECPAMAWDAARTSFWQGRVDVGGFDPRGMVVAALEVRQAHQTHNEYPRCNMQWAELSADAVSTFSGVTAACADYSGAGARRAAETKRFDATDIREHSSCPSCQAPLPSQPSTPSASTSGCTRTTTALRRQVRSQERQTPEYRAEHELPDGEDDIHPSLYQCELRLKQSVARKVRLTDQETRHIPDDVVLR